MSILQITRKADHVSMLCLNTVDVTLRYATTPTIIGTHVNVAELYDAIPIKPFRQIRHINGDMLYLQLLKSPSESIDKRDKGYGSQDQSHLSSIVFSCMEIPLATFPQETTESIDKLWHRTHRHHPKPNIHQ